MTEGFVHLRSVLPAPALLERRWRALALLNAVLDDSAYSLWTFETDEAGNRIGAFESGGGDHGFGIFNDSGAFLRLFDHESQLNPFEMFTPADGQPWPGPLDGIPDVFAEWIENERFADTPGYTNITTAVWHTGDEWCGNDPPPEVGGFVPDDRWMMEPLLEDVPAFGTDWPAYDRTLTAETVEPFVALGPLTVAQIRAISADANLEHVARVANAVGVTIV